MMYTRKIERQQLGFTLVELMVVIAILGLLVTIALPTFKKQLAKSYMTQVRADTKNAYTAASLYFSDIPDAIAITPADITIRGYTPTPTVNMNVNSGSQSTYSLVGSCLNQGHCKGTYQINAKGQVTDLLTVP